MRLPLCILLALAALAPTSAMASEWYQCRADGVTRPTCCCPPAADEAAAPDAPPTISRAGCCTVDVVDGSTSDLRTLTSLASTALPAVIPQVTIAAPPPAPPWRRTRHARSSQPRGPPALYLQHCALLI